MNATLFIGGGLTVLFTLMIGAGLWGLCRERGWSRRTSAGIAASAVVLLGLFAAWGLARRAAAIEKQAARERRLEEGWARIEARQRELEAKMVEISAGQANR